MPDHQLWGVFLQIAALAVTIVIVVMKVRASTAAAVATVEKETEVINSTVDGLKDEIKELRETIHKLHLMLAERAGVEREIDRRIARLEERVERLAGAE